jgi:UDP-N-acetylmuramoyl-L-alanyl-D-glutamate--2,6-diaminopimelate ligase
MIHRCIQRALSLYHYLLGWVGAILFRRPSRTLVTVGITGTKGKSTAIALLADILEADGHKVASLSSVWVRWGNKKERNRTGNTMPGRMFIQKFLARARKEGCDVALVEVTSQGIVQHRHRHISWDKAVFLDIHPEHIESHGSFEKYLAAKASFFAYVARTSPDADFFINDDDEHADAFIDAVGDKPFVLFSISDVSGDTNIPPSLSGEFNKVNIAAASAVAQSMGVDEETVENAVKHFKGLKGRMEEVKGGSCPIFIDYAHTPESLEHVQKYAKEQCKDGGKLWCVFGSAGGGRDIWKRPRLGEIAAHHCDRIILTDEDPYDENPDGILSQIKEGIKKGGFDMENTHTIPDRKEAITYAIGHAEKGDVVLCTGKGSEESIHLAHGKIQKWDEREAVEEAKKKRRTRRRQGRTVGDSTS